MRVGIATAPGASAKRSNFSIRGFQGHGLGRPFRAINGWYFGIPGRRPGQPGSSPVGAIRIGRANGATDASPGACPGFAAIIYRAPTARPTLAEGNALGVSESPPHRSRRHTDQTAQSRFPGSWVGSALYGLKWMGIGIPGRCPGLTWLAPLRRFDLSANGAIYVSPGQRPGYRGAKRHRALKGRPNLRYPRHRQSNPHHSAPHLRSAALAQFINPTDTVHQTPVHAAPAIVYIPPETSSCSGVHAGLTEMYSRTASTLDSENGERPITGLPGEMRKLRSPGLDPFGRCLLDIFNGLTDGHGSGQIEEQMGMVFDGIEEHGSAAKVLQHGGHVTVQRIANGIGDDAFAVLGAEDKMNMKAGEGLRHGLGRPFRAPIGLLSSDPGRCPGLALIAPLALTLTA